MRGKVECEEADVAGSFEGMEMVAHHRLTLSATARVGGKVRRRWTWGRGRTTAYFCQDVTRAV